jgi:hypothetical protein
MLGQTELKVPDLAFKVGGGEKDKQRGSVDRAIVAPASEDSALIWY